MKATTLILALLALASCSDATVDAGRAPPVQLVASSRRVPLRADGAPDPAALAGALAALGGDTAVDADIIGLGPRASAVTHAALVGAGLDPDRVRVAPPGRSAPELVLTSTHAVAAPCGRALRSDWLGDAASSLDSVGRCIQQNNLAEMLEDPMDLVRSPAPEPGSGERAARAVRLLDQGAQSQPLPAARSEQAPFAGGLLGGTAAPVGTVGSAQGNPLLGPLPGAAAP